jgi:hypothetical protein
MAWDTFWAIFSQTNLVTLVETPRNEYCRQCDQIGRIIANGEIVSFGQLFSKLQKEPKYVF